jgi:beta-lactamase class A
MMGWIRAILAALLMAIAGQAAAQTAPSAALQKGAASVLDLFNGKAAPEALFSPAFLANVPAAQVNQITGQLREQLGAARAVAKIEPRSPTAASLSIEFERGFLTLNLALAAAPPHLIEGLLVTGTEMKGDSFEKVLGEMKALPGRTNLAVAKLGGAAPIYLARHEAERPMAIGSAFKLFLLSELSRSIAAGERKWTDVVPLNRRSLPSGFLQAWPQGAPLTLHSLAALMISQSDNTATDVLLHALGREKVERMLPALGVKAADRNRPFLSTFEAFALKGGKDMGAAKRWVSATEAQRRAQLEELAKVREQDIDSARFTGAPVAIETVEWFASAEDLVRTMDWLRRNGGAKAHEILAINPGLGSSVAGRYGYLGYKGGSERGVINMTFLLRTKAGDWYSVAGSWNDPAKALEDQKFVALMSRAVALVR